MRQRSDAGWRETRAVMAREKKISNPTETVNDLNVEVLDAKRKVKITEHEKYVDAKVQREILLEAERKHKKELKKMQEDFFVAVHNANQAAEAKIS